MKVLKAILIIIGIIALIAFIIASVKVTKVLVDLDDTVKASTNAVVDIDKKTSAALTDARRLIVIAGGAATEAQKASKEEREFLVVANSRLTNNLDELQNVLVQTRFTMASVETTMQDVDKQTGAISVSAVDAFNAIPVTLADSQVTLNQATKSLQDVSSILDSADIPKTMANIQQTTANVQHSTAAIDVWVQRATKPENVVRSFIEKAIGIGGSLAQMIK